LFFGSFRAECEICEMVGGLFGALNEGRTARFGDGDHMPRGKLGPPKGALARQAWLEPDLPTRPEGVRDAQSHNVGQFVPESPIVEKAWL
jgi:hypothetical protein